MTIQVLNIDAALISGYVSSALCAAFAHNISSVLEVAPASVIDLFGLPASSTLAAAVVAGRRGLQITSFVTVPDGSSANAMADKLYSSSMRATIVSTVEELLGSSAVLLGRVGVQAVAIKPEPFSPLHPTTTMSTFTETTSSSITTVSVTGTSTRTSQPHHDMTEAVTTTGGTTSQRDGFMGAAAPTLGRRAILMWASIALVFHTSFLSVEGRGFLA